MKAGTVVRIPPANDPNPLVATAPFGKELLQVIATREPVDLFDGKNFGRSQATPVKFQEVTRAIDKARVLDRDFRRRPAAAAAGTARCTRGRRVSSPRHNPRRSPDRVASGGRRATAQAAGRLCRDQ